MKLLNDLGAGEILCTAFEGQRCVAAGDLVSVVQKLKQVTDENGTLPILIFEDATSAVIEVDLRGPVEEIIENLLRRKRNSVVVGLSSQKRSPGRPKLGVIAREVTLLPGQWDWLDAQSGGASAALRRLVHEAKKGSEEKGSARQSQDAVYKFMTAMAGDLPGFEEALRAFYRKDQTRFAELIKPWPRDIRAHVKKLVAAAALTIG